MKKLVLKKYLAGFLSISLAAGILGCGDTADTSVIDTTAVEDAVTEVAEETNIALDTSLKDVYAEWGMKAGTCLTTQMINDPELEQIILQNFNSVTMENALKPENILNQAKSIEAGDIVVEFNSDIYEMLDWAKANGMAVRGHTLVWYSQTPDWIYYEDFDTSKEFVDRDTMLSRMESMIKQVFGLIEEGGYSDLFYAYDVVNEAIMEDGKLRDNNYLQIIGDDYVWYAFYYANEYAPENINLFINDYNEQYKSRAYVDFVSTLVDEEGNSLIDGIGLQGHLYTYDNIIDYFKTVDRLGETGLILEVTELDIALGSWNQPLEADEDTLRAQGRFYYTLVDGLIERIENGSIQMDSLTFWGFKDALSWKAETSPLLFDNDNAPKPAYYGALHDRENAGYSD